MLKKYFWIMRKNIYDKKIFKNFLIFFNFFFSTWNRLKRMLRKILPSALFEGGGLQIVEKTGILSTKSIITQTIKIEKFLKLIFHSIQHRAHLLYGQFWRGGAVHSWEKMNFSALLFIHFIVHRMTSSDMKSTFLSTFE